MMFVVAVVASEEDLSIYNISLHIYMFLMETGGIFGFSQLCLDAISVKLLPLNNILTLSSGIMFLDILGSRGEQ